MHICEYIHINIYICDTAVYTHTRVFIISTRHTLVIYDIYTYTYMYTYLHK
jgi:hypothetical protein